MDLIHFHRRKLKTLPMSVTSLLGVLGLILVFVTGVVLDLLGSQLFKLVELGVFIDLVIQHFDWLVPFLKESRTYIGSDFDATHKTVRLTTALYFQPWKRKDVTLGARFRLYVRVNSFLIGYVTLRAGSCSQI
jgi:hypothetical protein